MSRLDRLLLIAGCLSAVAFANDRQAWGADGCYQRDSQATGYSTGYYLYSAAQDAEEDDCWLVSLFRGVDAAPRAPVVSSIPAIMLAQPAMAVSPNLMSEALRQRIQHEQQERLARELRQEFQKLAEALQQQGPAQSNRGAGTAPPAQLPETHALTSEERRELLETIESLNRQIGKLQSAVQGIERQLNEAAAVPMN